MTSIVVNTLTGAVSEYDWAFQSITPTHAGDATGLFLLGGDTDNENLIISRIQTGKLNWGGSLKKYLSKLFFGLKGSGAFRTHVSGENDDYTYRFVAANKGVSRAQPGRGIRESYLSFGFSNYLGQDFELDNIEVIEATSTSRRV